MQGRRYQLQPGRTWAGLGVFVALAAVLPGSLTTLSPSAAAQSVRTSALTPGTELLREADLPSVLAPSEEHRYRPIYGLLGTAPRASADRATPPLRQNLRYT